MNSGARPSSFQLARMRKEDESHPIRISHLALPLVGEEHTDGCFAAAWERHAEDAAAEVEQKMESIVIEEDRGKASAIHAEPAVEASRQVAWLGEGQIKIAVDVWNGP